jgi:putative transposase
MSNVTCKYCRSDHIVKYGKYKEVQRYLCKVCNRKFARTDTIPKMQYSTPKIADALSMFYGGMSLNDITFRFSRQYGDHISDVTILNWVRRFTEIAVQKSYAFKPDVGDIWIIQESILNIGGQRVWLWDVMDIETSFLIASTMSITRSSRDAQELIQQAYRRTSKIPLVIHTNKNKAYPGAIERVFGGDTRHKQAKPVNFSDNADAVTMLKDILRERKKMIGRLHTLQSLKEIIDGWLFYYNFIRISTTLKNKTPAAAAGIKNPYLNWKYVTEQPYDQASRFPLVSQSTRRI